MKAFERRTISIILSVIMVLSCFAGLTFSVGAETSGDYGYKVLDDGTVSITYYKGNDTDVTIPYEIDKKIVTEIGAYAFDCHRDIVSVKIPKGVRSIGNAAFYDCDSLVNIEIPDSVIFIDGSAFYNCSSLTNIRLPNNLTYISGGILDDCAKLKSITIPKNVEKIKNNFLKGCYNLQEITVSKENRNYKDVDGVLFDKNMDTLLIYPCGRDGVYRIPDGVKKIGEMAFYFNHNLNDIIIPDSVNKIENWAFCACTGLKKVVIPSSVDTIADEAFSGCYSLKKIIGFSGSEAEVYAKNNEIKFVSIDLCKHTDLSNMNIKTATCTDNGYSGDKHCKDCEQLIEKGYEIKAKGHIDDDYDNLCDRCGIKVKLSFSDRLTDIINSINNLINKIVSFFKSLFNGKVY